MLRNINRSILFLALILLIYGIFQLFFFVHIYPYGLLVPLCLLATGNVTSLAVIRFRNELLSYLLHFLSWVNCFIITACFFRPTLLNYFWNYSFGIITLLVIISLIMFLRKTTKIISTIGVITTILFGIMFEISLVLKYFNETYYKVISVSLIFSSLIIIMLLVYNSLNNYNLSKKSSKSG
jgi:hypothetical protein